MPSTGKHENIEIARIFLDVSNPRHEIQENEQEAIEMLCKHEKIVNMARDIVANGISPLEAFCVMKIEEENPRTMYIAKEGNRRLCALKLLIDPDSAPKSVKKSFETLSKSWTPITEVRCWVSNNKDKVALWIRRRHEGEADGLGQKPWSAEQKARYHGTENRNRIALEYLEWGQKNGLISKMQSKRKFTTITRFIGNPLLKNALGLELGENRQPARNKEEGEFTVLATKFFADLVATNSKVNSRANSKEISQYANEVLAELDGITARRIKPIGLNIEKKSTSSGKIVIPYHRQKPKFIERSEEITNSLDTANFHKLNSLYSSICTIPLKHNTPLLTVGVWAILESLTSLAGRNPRTSFADFLGGKIMEQSGFVNKEEKKEMGEILIRIQKNGNTTKHHKIAANFNDEQLANDVKAIEKFILHCIHLAKPNNLN